MARGRREVVVGRIARMDRDRPRRVGIPEVVLGEGKTVGHLLEILRRLHGEGMGALVSRPTRSQRTAIARAARDGLPTKELAGGRLIRLAGPLGADYREGLVAVVTAGTSDIPLAEEARGILEELGLRVVSANDVGVAGLHRLLRALRSLERSGPEIYLVFAGREGALPTVVAGMVHAPVVGVPTSVGYGRGGRGEAALNAMLQSCAPLAVVNIDAAVPAALFAAQRFARPVRGRGRGKKAPRSR
ncbi:MAG TPA: nickel pincer cofactor biosynthesis protein LarB [Thermoplasmata archaeon]|nr:nickel pincer cofactor biosynthesis protein LarB [Thermoplasmata archaeon]